MRKNPFDISWASLWKILFFFLLVVVMFLGRRILLGLFLAIVISTGLEFLVNFLERRGVPRTFGVILIFLTGAIVTITAVYAVIPLLIVDLNSALAKLSELEAELPFAPFLGSRTAQSVSEFVSRFTAQFLSGDVSPLSAFSEIIGGVALGVSVIVTSFYLSLSRNGVERFLIAVTPADYEVAALRIYGRAVEKIGAWFRSQLLLSAIVGGLVLVSLLILGVRYAFLIALLTAIFELMPYIGPLFAGSVAVLAALTESPELALYTIVAFVLVQQIESHILVPLLVGRGVGLHPVIVIIALLMGAEIGGFLGILISVPAAVVLQEVVEDHSDQKQANRKKKSLAPAAA